MWSYMLCFVFGIFVIRDVSCVCKTGVDSCYVDPCLVNTCDSYPYAVCKANYCDGCYAEFYLGDTKVDCTKKPDINIG